MKIKYEKSITVPEEIELKVPYYYEYMADNEYRMFGKLTDVETIEVSFVKYPNCREINIEYHFNPFENLAYILETCTESTKEKFEDAKKEALEFLK